MNNKKKTINDFLFHQTLFVIVSSGIYNKDSQLQNLYEELQSLTNIQEAVNKDSSNIHLNIINCLSGNFTPDINIKYGEPPRRSNMLNINDVIASFSSEKGKTFDYKITIKSNYQDIEFFTDPNNYTIIILPEGIPEFDDYYMCTAPKNIGFLTKFTNVVYIHRCNEPNLQIPIWIKTKIKNYRAGSVYTALRRFANQYCKVEV